jgi:hypothetical protein
MTDSMDRLVTDDLAELGAAKRHAPRSIEETLGAVNANRSSVPPARRAQPAALAVLALGGVYARRVGRAAGGVALFVY